MKTIKLTLLATLSFLFISTFAVGQDAKAEGEKFLKEKSKEKGVITLESGLMYNKVVYTKAVYILYDMVKASEIALHNRNLNESMSEEKLNSSAISPVQRLNKETTT